MRIPALALAATGLVILSAGLAGCDNNPGYYSNAYAKVVDDRVEVEAFCDPEFQVHVGDIPPFSCDKTHSDAKPSLPLESFPEGRNELEIRFESASNKSHTHTLKASFTREPGVGKPFVRVEGCSSASGSNAVALEGELGKVEYCWVQSDGSVKVELAASASGKLTIAGKDVPISGGKATFVGFIDGSVFAAPVATALKDGAGAEGPTWPVELKKDDKVAVSGQIKVTLGSIVPTRVRAVLAAVGTGVPLPRGDGASAANKKSLVYLPPVTYSEMVHYGKTSAVGEIGMVAIAKDREAREGGTCGPYATVGEGPGGPSSVSRQLIDLDVTIYDTTTAEVIAERTFDKGHGECPMILMTNSAGVWDAVESRPDDKVIARWLETVAKKGS